STTPDPKCACRPARSAAPPRWSRSRDATTASNAAIRNAGEARALAPLLQGRGRGGAVRSPHRTHPNAPEYIPALAAPGLAGLVVDPGEAAHRLRPAQGGDCDQGDMLDLLGRHPFRQRAARMRMGGAFRIGPDRKRQMHEALRPLIERTCLARGLAEPLVGGPDLRVVAGDAARVARQRNCGGIAPIGSWI